MPGLVPGIHVFPWRGGEDVDGRDKPGHDGERGRAPHHEGAAQRGQDGTRCVDLRALRGSSA
jgi:hypothetical protein